MWMTMAMACLGGELTGFGTIGLMSLAVSACRLVLPG